MRRQPVAFALIDVAFLADPKWRRLRRLLPDPSDFNAALGAWVIALCAARRNGHHELDVEEEVEDARFLDALRQVGLLTNEGFDEDSFLTWAPMSQQRRAGLARAASARRSPTGQFEPAEPARWTAGEPSVKHRVSRSVSPTSSRTKRQRAGSGGPASTPLPSNRRNNSRNEEGGPGGTDDGEDEETSVLAWLAQHGCYVAPGNGYHRAVVTAVAAHGGEALLGAMRRLAKAGVKRGDTKGYLFGAIDMLNSAVRPKLSDVARLEAEERDADASRRRRAQTQEYLAQFRVDEGAG